MLLYQNIFGGMRRHEQPPTFGRQGGGGDPLLDTFGQGAREKAGQCRRKQREKKQWIPPLKKHTQLFSDIFYFLLRQGAKIRIQYELTNLTFLRFNIFSINFIY